MRTERQKKTKLQAYQDRERCKDTYDIRRRSVYDGSQMHFSCSEKASLYIPSDLPSGFLKRKPGVHTVLANDEHGIIIKEENKPVKGK